MRRCCSPRASKPIRAGNAGRLHHGIAEASFRPTMGGSTNGTSAVRHVISREGLRSSFSFHTSRENRIMMRELAMVLLLVAGMGSLIACDGRRGTLGSNVNDNIDDNFNDNDDDNFNDNDGNLNDNDDNFNDNDDNFNDNDDDNLNDNDDDNLNDNDDDNLNDNEDDNLNDNR